jgi:hypothetical protein
MNPLRDNPEVFWGHAKRIAEDPAASEIHFRPAGQKVELEDSLELARKFLKDCQENHELCHRKLTRLPSRVIDVGTQYPIRSVRLHWSEENEPGEYAGQY